MPQPTPITLNHFAVVRFTESYWSRDEAARTEVRRAWLTGLGSAGDVLHCYQLYGFEAGSDLLVWTARRAAEPETAATFFSCWAQAAARHRRLIEVRETLWGFTRPSQYTKTRSTQEIDPFGRERPPYLIVYPFVKTAEWYLAGSEERQRMMAGHIKTGKQYPDITQLLLYSYGLQDQEFVVVYEARDLTRFLGLVQDLRGTEARRYTQRDWPLHAGLHQRDAEALSQWL